MMEVGNAGHGQNERWLISTNKLCDSRKGAAMKSQQHETCAAASKINVMEAVNGLAQGTRGVAAMVVAKTSSVCQQLLITDTGTGACTTRCQ